MRIQLASDHYVKVAFISPTGGLKLIISLDFKKHPKLEEYSIDKINHLFYSIFEDLEFHFKTIHKIQIDKACKDTVRLCFLPADPHIVVNDVSLSHVVKSLKKKVEKQVKTQEIQVKRQEAKSCGTDYDLTELYNFFNENNIDPFHGDRWNRRLFFISSLIKYFGVDNYDTIKSYWTMYSSLGDESNMTPIASLERQFKAFIAQDGFNNPKFKGDMKFIFKLATDRGYEMDETCKLKYELRDVDAPLIFREQYNLQPTRSKATGVLKVNTQMLNPDYFSRTGETIMEDYTETIGATLCNRMKENWLPRWNESTQKNYLYDMQVITYKDYYKEWLEENKTDDSSHFDKMVSLIKNDNEHINLSDTFLRWMLGSFKNSFNDGSEYYDQILTIRGTTGSIGKSFWIKNIFLGFHNRLGWFDESFSWATGNNKDQQRKLFQNHVLFDDEMNGMDKSTVNNIKQITSIGTIKFRKEYDREPQSYNRIASFMSATNDEQFIKDKSLLRRYCVISTEDMGLHYVENGTIKINFNNDHKKIDYAKVWGYVYHLWKEGETFNDYEYNHDLANEKYRSSSSGEFSIKKVIEPGDEQLNDGVWIPFFELEPILQERMYSGTANSKNISGELRNAGFVKDNRWNGYYKKSCQQYYVKLIDHSIRVRFKSLKNEDDSIVDLHEINHQNFIQSLMKNFNMTKEVAEKMYKENTK